MQRIRKLSNDLKEALIPKLDKSDSRWRPSYRGGQPVQTGDSRKTANQHHDASATTSRSSREGRNGRDKRKREGHSAAMKPAREQGTTTSSVAFPPSSSRSKATPTKAQEKPVPVPSVNHKQTASEDTSWDRDAGRTSPTTSPFRYALDRWAKPLPSPPGTALGRKPHRRCPYSPSRYYAMSQSSPHVPFPAQPGTPTTNGCSAASPADAETSTSHSTQSQPGTPSWPPEGPATVKRQQRTPKSSIDSLYRSQTDMKNFQAPATAAGLRDAGPGHGHSRTASAPASGDADSSPRRREQQTKPDPEPKALFGEAESMISSRASFRTTTSTIDPKTSLQVRELSTSRSVNVQSSGAMRRAASHKAQIVYPSYVTGALPPLPDQAPAPAPQRQEPASTRTRSPRLDQAAALSNPPMGHDKSYTMPRRRAKQDQQIEVSYTTLREIAQMEGKKRSEDLAREFAQWDKVDEDAAPASTPSNGGTRPLVVKKRSAMFGAREPRSARR